MPYRDPVKAREAKREAERRRRARLRAARADAPPCEEIPDASLPEQSVTLIELYEVGRVLQMGRGHNESDEEFRDRLRET